MKRLILNSERDEKDLGSLQRVEKNWTTGGLKLMNSLEMSEKMLLMIS